MQGNDIRGEIGSITIWPTDNWQQAIKTAGGKPDNFLECNGQVVNSSKYPKLAKIMSSVPNYQGLFLRGYGSQNYSQINGSLNGATNTTYSSSSIGIIQGDAIRNITGQGASFADYSNFSGALYSTGNTGWTADGSHNYDKIWYLDVSRVVPTADEIRPVNTAVIYLIRAK